MSKPFALALLLSAAIAGWPSDARSVLIPGLLSDFETGTSELWFGGSSPVNVADGGPAGAGDNFLLFGNGGKLAVFNSEINGIIDPAVTAIQVDMMRPATDLTSLDMRLVLFGPSTDNRWTSSVAAVVPNDGIWRTYTFSIFEADLAQVFGGASYSELFSALDRIMFRHDPDPPSATGVAVDGTIGIDNVFAVPEPATGLLLAGGLLGLGLGRHPSRL